MVSSVASCYCSDGGGGGGGRLQGEGGRNATFDLVFVGLLNVSISGHLRFRGGQLGTLH